MIYSAISGFAPVRTPMEITLFNPVDGGAFRVAVNPIGVGGAFLLVGSERSDFPTEVQRPILVIGANTVATGLNYWHVETDEHRLAALLGRSSDFIGFAASSGAVRYINPAGRALLGLEKLDDYSQLRILDLFPPEEAVRVRDELWPRLTRDGRWIGEIGFRHFQTADVIPFLHDWFVIDDPRTGQPMNIAAVSRDLTKMKRWEADLRDLNETLEGHVSERTAELAAANAELRAEIAERAETDAQLKVLQAELFHVSRLSLAGQMAAALAHEVNQPLAAASNFVSVARRLLIAGSVETETIVEAMDEAIGQVLRAGQIIRRLRNFVGRGEAEKRFESISGMVEEASALVLTNAEAVGVTVRYQFDGRASLVFADRIQIQQVLSNLIRNALEAMAGCERRDLTISTILLDEATVEIGVADSGSGLSEEVVRHLFEPFVSTKDKGMGLGLSICRAIVEAHGGTLRGEPNMGGGALFLMTLPTVAADDSGHAD
ncbi:MAG TPA: ATP-binding protein [Stellaceae bacterium]|nr:ATP-binding protein [Stellaceae bacterium]